MFSLGLLWLLSGDDAKLQASREALSALADESRLRAMAAELVPALEKRAGRRFLQVPRVRLLSRDDILTTYRTELAALDPGLTEAELETIIARRYAELGVASGVYDTGLQEILLNRDAVSRMTRGLDPEVVTGLTRCLLGHELVHALQDQHLGLTSLTLPADLRLLWVEGQAEWLAEEVCPEGIERGGSRPSLYDPEIKEELWPYVFGANAARLAAEVHGVEAIWAALAGRSPSRVAMDALLSASQSPSWRDPKILRPMLAPLERPRIDHLRLSLWWSPSLLGPFTPYDDPRVADPMISETVGVSPYQIMLLRGRGAGTALGGAFVTARCRTLDQGIRVRGEDLFIFLGFTMTGYEGPGARLPRVEAELEAEGDAACAVKFNLNTGHYYELWVSQGAQLAGGTLFAREAWASDLKKLTQAVAEALAVPLDDTPPDVSQHPTMRALTPPAEPLATGWSPTYLERAFLLMPRQWASPNCSLAEALAPHYGQFEALGGEAQVFVYVCAAEAGDLDALDAHLPPTQATSITPLAALVRHLQLLRDAGRAKDAKALAEARCPLYAPTERSFCLAAAR